jgi:hypothetical protein
MMVKPYNINIYMPDGDPNGMRVITRSGWTGKAVLGPKEMWEQLRTRKEFTLPGIYILVGAGDDEQPMIYVGQSDELRGRIDSHYKNKDFWDWLITFTATDGSLNSAMVQWLEYDLIQRAKATQLAQMANAVSPTAPSLREELLADIKNFSEELYSILPLVGLHCFSQAKIVKKISNTRAPSRDVPQAMPELDTMIVPTNPAGFEEAFIGQNAWWSVRISSTMLPKIKYIAAYQTAPLSAITHLAKVQSIVSFGDTGKYKLIFDGPATTLKTPIAYGNSPRGTMQSPVYTSLQKLQSAQILPDLFPFGTP